MRLLGQPGAVEEEEASLQRPIVGIRHGAMLLDMGVLVNTLTPPDSIDESTTATVTITVNRYCGVGQRFPRTEVHEVNAKGIGDHERFDSLLQGKAESHGEGPELRGTSSPAPNR